MLSFNRLILGILLNVNRSPLFYDHNAGYYNMFKVCETKPIKNKYTLKEHAFVPAGWVYNSCPKRWLALETWHNHRAW